MENEKTFHFYFLDGTLTTVNGTSVSSAFSKRYAPDAIQALDLYEESDTPSYVWSEAERNWVRS